MAIQHEDAFETELCEYLAAHGLVVEAVLKVHEGRPNVVDRMINGGVQLVINTTQGAKAIADSYSIRRNALLTNIPYFTTIAAGLAAVDALEVSSLLRGAAQVRSIQEWHARSNG